MIDKISHAYALTLVEEGLKQHALMDRGCKCDPCIDRYGPEGSPGRCGSCRDAQQGEGCDDARRYAAIRDALTSPPSVMAGNTCEPGCVRSSLHQGDCEFGPDPLDENDHRDRIDRNGDRWTHRSQGTMQWCVESCNCFGVWDLSDIDYKFGPLRFAPDDLDVDEVVAAVLDDALDDEVEP